MKSNEKVDLAPGSVITTCAGCGIEMVTFEEMAGAAPFCSERCEENHSLFKLDNVDL
ncbi:hypothetical protein [Solibacillus sp. NPDC093137]|uniref:hypothetical protein n=1 Tax=Solibacillus sp. NPDC093137 TaxID=3390678 RepID=UPI003D014774